MSTITLICLTLIALCTIWFLVIIGVGLVGGTLQLVDKTIKRVGRTS